MVQELKRNMNWSGPASNAQTSRGKLDLKISIAMMIEPGPKTYNIARNANDSEQWKDAIGNEMVSIASHRVFTFVQKVRNGTSIIES